MYNRSIFFDSNGSFMGLEKLRETLKNKDIIFGDVWPHRSVYESYQKLGEVDSITIDPHKLGYIPYSAGAVVFKDDRIKDTVACFAPYVFRDPNSEKAPQLVGMYIMEGSKPGAAAAACWLAHRVVPLNIEGYGKIIGESIEGANELHEMLKGFDNLTVTHEGKSREFCVKPLTRPDLNIVCYAFNLKGNRSLKLMNDLNDAIKEHKFSFKKGDPLHKKKFIISSTSLTREEYGDAPLGFVKSLGIPEDQWHKVGEISVLRSSVLTPYLTPDYIAKDYVETYRSAILTALDEMVSENLIPFRH